MLSSDSVKITSSNAVENPGQDSWLAIEPLNERWLDFISSHPDSNIFHHPAWIEALAKCYGYHPFIMALLNSDREILAGLPFMEIQSRLTGKRWTSLPFSDHCILLSRDHHLHSRFLNGLASYPIISEKPRIELRGNFSESSFHLFKQYFLHTIHLEPDIHNVFNRIHPMHRRNIRVAESFKVHVEFGGKQEIDDFYRLHLSTRQRQGVPVQPKKFFDLIEEFIFQKNLGFLLLAYQEKKCIAASVFLHWKNTLTYKFGASSVDDLKLRPNNLIMWKAIQWGCENGFNILDLGRTDLSNTGLQEYKRRWGAEEKNLTYFSSSEKPKHVDSGHLNRIMEAVIKNSPVWICQLAGELLYRHFG